MTWIRKGDWKKYHLINYKKLNAVLMCGRPFKPSPGFKMRTFGSGIMMEERCKECVRISEMTEN